jgi:hypothetical protein
LLLFEVLRCFFTFSISSHINVWILLMYSSIYDAAFWAIHFETLFFFWIDVFSCFDGFERILSNRYRNCKYIISNCDYYIIMIPTVYWSWLYFIDTHTDWMSRFNLLRWCLLDLKQVESHCSLKHSLDIMHCHWEVSHL